MSLDTHRTGAYTSLSIQWSTAVWPSVLYNAWAMLKLLVVSLSGVGSWKMHCN